MRVEKTLDEADLSAHDAAAIEECLASPALSPKPGPPDRFCYTLSVDDGGGSARRSVSFREGEEPPAIRPLIASLKRSPGG